MATNREFIPLDPKRGWPYGPGLFYLCTQCGDSMPAHPDECRSCSCGNLHIDVDAGRLAARDEQAIRLFRCKQ